MKKVVALLLACATLLFLCGCGAKEYMISSLVYVGKINGACGDLSVYCDVNTKVMYAHGYQCFTVLFNSDGTPMLWEGGEE